MQQPSPTSGNGRMHAVARNKIEALAREAEAVEGVARLIRLRASEVLDKGGTAMIQPQMAYLTGGLARLLKDWGVVEQLQQQGVILKPLPRAR